MFNKQQIKSFVSGVIITSLIFTTIYAAPVEKSIKALFNNIKIYVDDKLIEPKDANGNKVEPFIYNGTTYLPVRAVGNAFDKTVNWDGKTNSVYIGKHDSTRPSVYLNTLDYFNFQSSNNYNNWDYWNSEKDKDSTGKNYNNGIKLQMYDTAYKNNNWLYTEYLLNQKYKTYVYILSFINFLIPLSLC